MSKFMYQITTKKRVYILEGSLKQCVEYITAPHGGNVKQEEITRIIQVQKKNKAVTK